MDMVFGGGSCSDCSNNDNYGSDDVSGAGGMKE